MNEFLGRGTTGVPGGGRGRGTKCPVICWEKRGSTTEGEDDVESGESEGPGVDGVSKSTKSSNSTTSYAIPEGGVHPRGLNPVDCDMAMQRAQIQVVWSATCVLFIGSSQRYIVGTGSACSDWPYHPQSDRRFICSHLDHGSRSIYFSSSQGFPCDQKVGNLKIKSQITSCLISMRQSQFWKVEYLHLNS